MELLKNKVLVLCPKGLENLLQAELEAITGEETTVSLSRTSIAFVCCEATPVLANSRYSAGAGCVLHVVLTLACAYECHSKPRMATSSVECP